MSYILQKQQERNTSTANHWDLYNGHRQHVMALLQEVCPGPNARLCVLGAGNCNDLDLPRLSEWYAELHLVDWDSQSLMEGVRKQGISSESVVMHSGIELTGAARYMERWKTASPSNDEINQVISLLSRPNDIGLDTPFDVVLSSSLLTQLIELPVALLGLTHPRTVEIAMSIRAAHFRLIVSLLAPGATGVLVTELTSSDTCKDLSQYPEDALSELKARLIKEKQFFVGTNPQALAPALHSDPLVAARIESTRLTDPWLWQIGPSRFFLAYGFVFKR